MVAHRRAELASVAKMSESEVRGAFLKQIEQESMRDAMQLSQHILDDAKARAEEQARNHQLNGGKSGAGRRQVGNSGCNL